MNRHETDPGESAQPIAGLLHQLTRQLSTLLRQELTLARTELYQSLLRLTSSVGVILIGIALLYATLLLLLVSAVVALAILVPVWAAALGLGVLTFVSGVALVQRGRRLLKTTHLAPSHLPQSLKKDKDVLLRKQRTPL